MVKSEKYIKSKYLNIYSGTPLLLPNKRKNNSTNFKWSLVERGIDITLWHY